MIMIKSLLVSGTVLFLCSCASYIPPADPQFSCNNVYTTGKVSLTGNDLKHSAMGYCRAGMKQKNFEYFYDGQHYMTVKYKDNVEKKCSCLNERGKWYPTSEMECRKRHGHL